MKTKTVYEAVLGVIIAAPSRRKIKVVSPVAIQSAHKKHPLSGLRRLRELREAGLLYFEYDQQTKRYFVSTPVKNLRAIRRAFRDGLSLSFVVEQRKGKKGAL